jgi:hypothetical protein
MCEQCKNNEPDMYPDLGKGAMMDIHVKKLWVTADKEQGMRIAQKRHVTYMGPEGVESRDETQCIYVGWNDLEETIRMMLAMKMKVEDDNDTPDP